PARRPPRYCHFHLARRGQICGSYGLRHRSRHRGREYRSRVSAFLLDQGKRHGRWAFALPDNHRSSRRDDLGLKWHDGRRRCALSPAANSKGVCCMTRAMVYVVDDDAEFRKSVSRLLTLSGFETADYESGTLFLEQVKGSAPGCVLLDLD